MTKHSKHAIYCKLSTGTHFGKRESMRIKLSQRDFLLIAGIIVAVIIGITTLTVYDTLPEAESNVELPSLIKFSNPLAAVNKLGSFIFQNLF